MKVTSRVDQGSRNWLAFIACAICVCLAFGILGIATGAAFAAPEASSSSSAAASSSSAADEAATTDAADTATETTGTTADFDLASLPLGNDLLLGSEMVSSDGQTVVANLFASGASVDLNKTIVGADAFVAGQDVKVTDMTSSNNIFLAGNNITVSGTTGKTVMAAGNNLDIAVDADNMYAAGRTVFVKGTFEGDVTVAAANVVIDPYIVVKGTLDVTAEQEPTIASTAKVGSYNFTQQEMDTGVDVASGFANIGSPAWIQNLIWTLISMLVVAILIMLMLRTEMVDAMGRLVRNRPVAILVTGLLSAILLPVLIVGLFISVVAWPFAMVLCLIAIGATVLSVIYTAVALGRAILPRVNKWITSILFAAIFAVLMCIPVVDIILAVICIVFTFGSFIQGWWVWRRGKDISNDSDDEYEQSEFQVPRGEHFAQTTGSVATPAYTPSGMGQPIDTPMQPDEPRNWS